MMQQSHGYCLTIHIVITIGCFGIWILIILLSDDDTVVDNPTDADVSDPTELMRMLLIQPILWMIHYCSYLDCWNLN